MTCKGKSEKTSITMQDRISDQESKAGLPVLDRARVTAAMSDKNIRVTEKRTHELSLFTGIAKESTIALKINAHGTHWNRMLVVKIYCIVLARIPIGCPWPLPII